MKLKLKEKEEFFSILSEVLSHEKVQDMKNYVQHSDINTFDHCLRIAYYCFYFAKRLPIYFDIESLTRGAMLHDLYLYDWHKPEKWHKWHGFYHPGTALKNAKKYFTINKKEADIIYNHMWPLTLTHMPGCREALLVCLVDKCCSLGETLHLYRLIPENRFERSKSPQP